MLEVDGGGFRSVSSDRSCESMHFYSLSHNETRVRLAPRLRVVSRASLLHEDKVVRLARFRFIILDS